MRPATPPHAEQHTAKCVQQAPSTLVVWGIVSTVMSVPAAGAAAAAAVMQQLACSAARRHEGGVQAIPPTCKDHQFCGVHGCSAHKLLGVPQDRFALRALKHQGG
jgi:hypothetical protein